MGLLDQILGGVLRQGGQTRGSGGLGDLLGGLAGGRGGGNVLLSLLPVVLAMLANRGSGGGGLGGLLDKLQAGGLARQTQSWVSTGDNLPVSRDELTAALGHDQLSRIAAQAGVSEEQAGDGLAALLPDLVDRLTPQGSVPPIDQVDDSLASLQRSLAI